MRSRTPKVLHELCGLPMVLWPVRAALAAGAGAGRRRRLARAGAGGRCCRTGVELAVQPRANGTGGAVVAAMAAARRGGATDAAVVVLSGDVPLVERRGDRRARARARARAARARRWRRTVLEDPSGYGRVVRDARRRGAARGRDQGRGRRDARASCEIREVNTGIYVFSADALRDSAAAAERRQRPGRAVPAAGARPDPRRRAARSPPTWSQTSGWCSASTTASRSRTCARSPSRRSTSATCWRASASSTRARP